jgi:release factor glutamine methyltransferase
MKNSKTVFQDFVNQLKLVDSREEVLSMSYLVFEKVLGISKTDIMAQKPIISSTTETQLKEIVHRMNDHEPVQYILGEADFFGRKFKVSPAVLIPRPETEEMVTAIKHLHASGQLPGNPKILDIGTGSGCIPITLALEMPEANFFATDVSPEALKVAAFNAQKLKAEVTFIEHDILNSEISIHNLNLIVSNPPYIPLTEKNRMHTNVIEYEPHLALFVSDDDPLIFYKSIAKKSFAALVEKGILIVEINERFGEIVLVLFLQIGFVNVEIIKDVSAKDRIVKGQKSF